MPRRELLSLLCDDLGGGMGGWAAQEGGHIYIHTADSLYGTVATNTTL